MKASALRPSEEACERSIIDAARLLGYLVHGSARVKAHGQHLTPLKGDRGFPDLVILGHGRLLVVELKRKPGKPTVEQWQWLNQLQLAGAQAELVWVPEDMPEFIARLQEWAGR